MEYGLRIQIMKILTTVAMMTDASMNAKIDTVEDILLIFDQCL